MNNVKLSQAQGLLLAAAAAGDKEALWRMARRDGVLGDLAKMALDQLTAPNSNYSLIEAVNKVIQMTASGQRA